MSLFSYPSAPLERRHGPRGYSDYQAYKPWLRDEATFRCVYCRVRERLHPDGSAAFGVDHLVPKSHSAERVHDYENLAYACVQCNALKGDMGPLPNPYSAPLGQYLEVQADGGIRALTGEGAVLIAVLRLDSPRRTLFRQRWLRLLGYLQGRSDEESAALLRWLLSFPEDLPNLAALRPPGGNTRPEGLRESYFALRERGLLPDTY
jgi:HNH endonuclease